MYSPDSQEYGLGKTVGWQNGAYPGQMLGHGSVSGIRCSRMEPGYRGRWVAACSAVVERYPPDESLRWDEITHMKEASVFTQHFP